MALPTQLRPAFDLAQNASFQQRIAVASLNQVVIVASEAGATTDHANRLILAQQVAYNPYPWATRMALGIIIASANISAAVNPANTPDQNNTAVADADIVASVATVWNFYADGAVALAGSTGNKVL